MIGYDIRVIDEWEELIVELESNRTNKMKWYKVWNNNKNVDAIETVSKLRVVEWLRECHEWMK